MSGWDPGTTSRYPCPYWHGDPASATITPAAVTCYACQQRPLMREWAKQYKAVRVKLAECALRGSTDFR